MGRGLGNLRRACRAARMATRAEEVSGASGELEEGGLGNSGGAVALVQGSGCGGDPLGDGTELSPFPAP